MSFFIGRTLTFTVAGLALKVVGSPVNGLMPLRAFFAGTATAVILRMPGSTKVRGPFLLIEARIVSSSAAITARTSLAAAPVVPARCWISADFVRTLLIYCALRAGFLAGLRADFFLAFAMGER